MASPPDPHQLARRGIDRSRIIGAVNGRSVPGRAATSSPAPIESDTPASNDRLGERLMFRMIGMGLATLVVLGVAATGWAQGTAAQKGAAPAAPGAPAGPGGVQSIPGATD